LGQRGVDRFRDGLARAGEALAKNAPVVKAFAFQAQVLPFDVHWLTIKFQPGAEACSTEKASASK
jgi:hypothetical protein